MRATFHLEPAATVDLDVFIKLPGKAKGTILNRSDIYEYLHGLGYKSRAEYIDIGSWPVQSLVAGNALEEEAIKEAVVTEVEGIKTRVMTAEHLIAIALRTGRAKDHARIVQFVAEGALDRAKLHGILGKHKLLRVWEKFARKYLNE